MLLFIGFAIKVPSVPLHTWLPDAHVEAPTPISMILAGVLLEDGRLRHHPHLLSDLSRRPATTWPTSSAALGVVSMVYGAFAALAQTDFKRLVAYSSVSHMGYVVLGLGVWSAVAGNGFNPDYWKMGMNGAMFQMIAHGISSAGMFFMVGVIYDRVHHRNLNEFGGLFAKMPVYSGLAIGIFFAGLGLPGLVRIHRRSARRALGLELQHAAGRDLRLRRDPDRRLHPVDDAARLPRRRVQGPAPRSPHADDAPRAGDRRAAAWRSRSSSA